jgi:hypothetical protein
MPVAASSQIDPDWSLYYNTGRGRVSGVTGLDFSVDSTDDIVYVTMTVKGIEGQKEASRTLIRWVHMRSHDD